MSTDNSIPNRLHTTIQRHRANAKIRRQRELTGFAVCLLAIACLASVVQHCEALANVTIVIAEEAPVSVVEIAAKSELIVPSNSTLPQTISSYSTSTAPDVPITTPIPPTPSGAPLISTGNVTAATSPSPAPALRIPTSNSTTTSVLLQQQPTPSPTTTPASPTASAATSCAGYRLLDVQPMHSEAARITLCHRPATQSTVYPSATPIRTPNTELVHAVFYEQCIEDTENATGLPFMWASPCDEGVHQRFEYGNHDGEHLYVLQNGSLLRTGANHSEYDVFEAYCLFEAEDGDWRAQVCYDEVVSVSRAQAYLYAICMLVSVPCLLVTAYVYLAIPQLRNLHGKSLACHSLCLALGFLLLSVVQIRGSVGTKTGYFIQYLLLSCFLWLGVMCVDICTHVWYFIPRLITITPRMRTARFLFYAAIAQGIPLILVSLTIHYNLSGMPSYFLKGVTVATRWSQQFFIPPISTILMVCFILLIVSYFGFRELNPQIAATFLRKKQLEDLPVQMNMEMLDVYLFEETKQIARSTAYLYIIMAMNWLFEIISFYVSSSSSVELFDILNALQGIVIFIIFVSLPRPLHIIKRWWSDRGEWNTTEMEQLQPTTTVPAIRIANVEDGYAAVATKEAENAAGNRLDDVQWVEEEEEEEVAVVNEKSVGSKVETVPVSGPRVK